VAKLETKFWQEVKKNIQIDMLSSFIKADTEKIEDKHSGKYISNLNFDVRVSFVFEPFLRSGSRVFQCAHACEY